MFSWNNLLCHVDNLKDNELSQLIGSGYNIEEFKLLQYYQMEGIVAARNVLTKFILLYSSVQNSNGEKLHW